MLFEDVPQARVFLALWPPEEVRAHLHELAAQLHGACGGRITRLQTLHLTLVFIGNIAVGRLQALHAAAGQVRGSAFQLHLSQYGYWHSNHIAWAAPAQVPDALSSLVRDLELALQQADFSFDKRKYVPHVTLLRKSNCPSLLHLQLPHVPTWNVTDYVLVRSTPSASGSTYEVVERWLL